jgi:hypothetical protein
MFRRFRGAILREYEPAELLPNVVKAKWDEGCIM